MFLTICRIRHIIILNYKRKMTKYDIEFYSKENGEEPAREFILELDEKMQAKMLKIIDLLEVNGPQMRLPYSESLEDGIFEIRAKQSSNITRVLYFFAVGRKIILTNGFVKKTRKTPKREIKLAKKYRADYERRLCDE